MTHRTFQFLFAIMISIAVVTLAGGIAYAQSTKVPIRIAVQPNILPEIILRAQKTLEKKYGDKYDIRWIDVTHAAPAIEAIVAREVDITDAGVLPLIQGRERGLEYWAVADAVGDVTGIVVRTDSAIRTAADLKGKTLAFPGRGSWQHGLLQLALEGTGVSDSDINLVRARFPEMPLLLEKKAVDGFSGAEPFMSMTLSKGQARLLFRPASKLQQKEGTLISGHVVARAGFAREHPDALRAFLKEFGDASRFIRNNPQEAAKIYAQVFPGVVTEDVFLYAVNHGLVYLADVKPRPEDWVKFIAFTNKAGLTKIADPKAFVKDYVHPEFVER